MEMKMAKASDKDLDKAIAFLNACESVLDNDEFPEGHEKEGQGINDCSTAVDLLNEQFQSAYSSLNRVIWGYYTLISPSNKLINPDSSVLELHPDLVKLQSLVQLRPASEYHEDMGSVLWWKLPIEEPPYVGTSLDTDFPKNDCTHFSPLPVPQQPQEDK